MDLKGTNTIINLLNAGYTADEIAEIAFKEEEVLEEAAKMKTITSAREEVANAFNEYNAALGYTTPMPKEFWDAIFEIYEEGLNYNKKKTRAEEKEWSLLDLLDLLADSSEHLS